MALVFTDGFDSYAATSDLTKKWSTATGGFTWSSSAGKTGGGGVTCAAGAAGGVFNTPVSLVATNPFFVGFNIKLSAKPSSNTLLWSLFTSASLIIGSIRINSATGFIALLDNSGIVILTGSINVADNNWHWLEFQLNTSAAAVALAWYVDGTLDSSGTGDFAQHGTVNVFRFLQNNNAMGINGLDDFIVYDTNTPSPKTSDFPLGPRVISTIRPSADAVVQFARSSGSTNFSLVNEVNADDDTSYVQDATQNDQDLYDFDDISFSPTAINGIMLNGRIENSNAGTRNYAMIAKNTSGSQLDGTSTLLPISYATKQQYFGQDPATSAAWTRTGLNTCRFGIKVP